MALPKDKIEQPLYVFTLYVAGMNPHSLAAIKNIKKICEEHLYGRYELKIIDLSQTSQKDRMSQVNVVPTLIKDLPVPIRKTIGDLAKTHKVIIAMEII